MVSTLSTEHLSGIVTLLSDFYKQCNSDIGAEYYYSDQDFLAKHVTKRLQDSTGPIKYIGIVRDGELKGFINYFNNDRLNILEIWCIVGSKCNQSEIKEMINYCIDERKKKGYKKITFELSDGEKELGELFGSLGARKITNLYFLN